MGALPRVRVRSKPSLKRTVSRALNETEVTEAQALEILKRASAMLDVQKEAKYQESPEK